MDEWVTYSFLKYTTLGFTRHLTFQVIQKWCDIATVHLGVAAAVPKELDASATYTVVSPLFLQLTVSQHNG